MKQTPQKQENKLPSPVGVGVITIITVLLVLSLTIFSALTLSSARADYTLSQTNADTVAAYYQADCEAVKRYAEFAAGTESELDELIPISETQSLHLHLIRDGFNQIWYYAWDVTPNEGAGQPGDLFLPVWEG